MAIIKAKNNDGETVEVFVYRTFCRKCDSKNITELKWWDCKKRDYMYVNKCRDCGYEIHN